MQDHPVLGQVALGYSPMIDRQRAVVATRLTIFPQRADTSPDAAELLRTQALRQAQPGFAHPADSELQTEFEDSFIYQETEDQLLTLRQIKKDLQTARPIFR